MVIVGLSLVVYCVYYFKKNAVNPAVSKDLSFLLELLGWLQGPRVRQVLGKVVGIFVHFR